MLAAVNNNDATLTAALQSFGKRGRRRKEELKKAGGF
jgi:hypothetical protein